MESKNIQKLTEFMKKENGRNYPIHNLLLNDEEDFVKKDYFKMLAVILCQGDEITEMQKNLFFRLLCGTKTEYTLEDYMKNALNVEINDFLEFIDECKDKNLKYRFLIDALILVYCDQYTEEQIDVITYFMEYLSIAKDELKYLIQICKSILLQDNELYWNVYWKINDNIKEDITLDFIKDYVEYYIKDNTEIDDNDIKIKKLQQATLEEKFMDVFDQCEQKQVIVENVKFDFEKLNQMHFSNNKFIKFKNCSFLNDTSSLVFKNIDFISFDSCTFENYSSRVIKCEGVKSLIVNGCRFENCYYHYAEHPFYNNWGELGAIIYSINDDMENFQINNSLFHNCGGVNEYERHRSAIITNVDVEIVDCKFSNCWHYYDTECIDECYIDPDDSSRTLFTTNSINENNILENCAKFN